MSYDGFLPATVKREFFNEVLDYAIQEMGGENVQPYDPDEIPGHKAPNHEYGVTFEIDPLTRAFLTCYHCNPPSNKSSRDRDGLRLLVEREFAGERLEQALSSEAFCYIAEKMGAKTNNNDITSAEVSIPLDSDKTTYQGEVDKVSITLIGYKLLDITTFMEQAKTEVLRVFEESLPFVE